MKMRIVLALASCVLACCASSALAGLINIDIDGQWAGDDSDKADPRPRGGFTKPIKRVASKRSNTNQTSRKAGQHTFLIDIGRQ